MTDGQDDPDQIPLWDPPDTVVALEPDTLPNRPLTAADAKPLIAKDIA
jgi:hypothetical protein